MTDQTAQPTPEQMERARQIAANGYYPIREDQMLIPYGRERVLSGDMDHTVQVQTALTAILQSDQQQAELLRHAEAMAGDISRALACTPSIKIEAVTQGEPKQVIVYDCGDPWEILRNALTEYQKGRSDAK